MPHVIVKFHPGRSDADKQSMAAAVAAALHETMGYDVRNVSVAVEEIEKDDWMSEIYESDIAAHQDRLVKPPGYGRLAPQL